MNIYFLKKFFIIIKILLFFITYNSIVFAAENSSTKLIEQEWSFKGFVGTFDRSALQRGYKVYREVCSGCHSMRLLYYRDLKDIGFSDEEVNAIASEYLVIDGPNDEGEMFERQAKASDKFVSPYANDQEARVSNNGAYPPDLSVIVKARKNGVNYLYSLLLGYEDPPSELELYDGMYYNKFIDGNQIAMPQPIYDESVDYDDGTINDLPQLSKDLVTFLAWASEPELEERKKLGIKVILFFLIMSFIILLAKRRLWKDVH